MKLKAGDNVVVIAGKNKGATGKVLRTLPKKDRVVIEGVNKVKRHVPRRGERAGQVFEFEAPIHASNVMLVDPKGGKRSRVGYTKDKAGKKQRIAKKSQSTI